jgi:hypothetical protein
VGHSARNFGHYSLGFIRNGIRLHSGGGKIPKQHRLLAVARNANGVTVEIQFSFRFAINAEGHKHLHYYENLTTREYESCTRLAKVVGE